MIQSLKKVLSPSPNGTDSKDQSMDEQVAATAERLSRFRAETTTYATEVVEQLLSFADEIGTSDMHLQPVAAGIDIRFRDNGVLQPLATIVDGTKVSIVTRLKVLSNLLTYQNDIPQEGRIAVSGEAAEVRVSTFPTLYGERAVLRFFGRGARLQQLEDLGHTGQVLGHLHDSLAETSGAVLVTGPAGSGKSTTLYASLRHLVQASGGSRSLLSIEDPIEVPIPGVAQSQVNAAAGFDLHTGLRSLLRQDPEVIVIGEIRDRLTAEIAIQACLTGQLMITTFHADSAATAISRLLDMGIEPYLLRSGLLGIVSQRLLRSLCECAVPSENPDAFCGLPIDHCKVAVGCQACHQTGYQGRLLASEFLSLKESESVDQLLSTRDSRQIYRMAVERGMTSLWERATDMVRQGYTSPSEVRRVLGMTMRI
ncbi:GspE/PulE family protein [Rhodopirellula sp. JC740]|uniref:GspE/PulE family protein n=1 Tax=Rhodopirellula halodulae TaxID=2894198 RepID=A0ABS8NMI0_9BACT|nr:GspE/PulE family protein [Rhodopirellula sp. JC740]